jgi:outer membrane lipoprotein LolB
VSLGRRAAATLLASACLGGCATLAPSADSASDGRDNTISGRLSVRVDGQPDRAVSAGFELSGDGRSGQLLLTGPLGATAARARWTPGQVLLERPGGAQEHFADLDALAKAALGEPVPIAALFSWLRGRAWPGASSTLRADGAPGFEQLGWQIQLGRWADGAVDAVRLAPPTITVRARVELPA